MHGKQTGNLRHEFRRERTPRQRRGFHHGDFGFSRNARQRHAAMFAGGIER